MNKENMMEPKDWYAMLIAKDERRNFEMVKKAIDECISKNNELKCAWVGCMYFKYGNTYDELAEMNRQTKREIKDTIKRFINIVDKRLVEMTRPVITLDTDVKELFPNEYRVSNMLLRADIRTVRDIYEFYKKNNGLTKIRSIGPGTELMIINAIKNVDGININVPDIDNYGREIKRVPMPQDKPDEVRWEEELLEKLDEMVNIYAFVHKVSREEAKERVCAACRKWISNNTNQS
jgi:hypothetical protein